LKGKLFKKWNKNPQLVLFFFFFLRYWRPPPKCSRKTVRWGSGSRCAKR